jgi:hypothetical protein
MNLLWILLGIVFWVICFNIGLNWEMPGTTYTTGNRDPQRDQAEFLARLADSHRIENTGYYVDEHGQLTEAYPEETIEDITWEEPD